mgnify:CR=1 FL=1
MPLLHLLVPDLSCGHCINAVTTALAGLPGVSEVQIELRTKKVQVTVTNATVAPTVRQRLEAAGYPATVAAT